MQKQTPSPKIQFLVFLLDRHSYALLLTDIERILRVVAITPVPGVDPPLLGLINLQGEIIPVLNLRRCLNLLTRDVELTDRLIITCSGGQKIALLVDEVQDIITVPPEDVITVAEASTSADIIQGIIKRDDEILFLCDFSNLSSLHLPSSRPLSPRLRGEGEVRF